MAQDTSGKRDKTAQPTPEAARKARLTAALRENLKKRKAQVRARAAAPGDGPDDGGATTEKQSPTP